MKKASILFFISCLFSLSIKAQQYVLLAETAWGGSFNQGAIVEYNPFTHRDTILFSFDSTDGSGANSSLLLGNSGWIYGSCYYGGSQGDGTLFGYNLITHTETTLINFDDSNGNGPGWELLIHRGYIYGTTNMGGKYGYGTIYHYNISLNSDSVVFNFNDTDGSQPWGGLMLLSDTTFLGMTFQGGKYNSGAIYSFNPVTFKEKNLFDFNGTINGTSPGGTLVKDTNGLLYDLLAGAGPKGGGALFSYNLQTNTETNLFNFDDTLGKDAQGYAPFGSVLIGSDGLLYGLTAAGGSSGDGVLFSYNISSDKYSILMTFNGANGWYPGGCSLIEDTARKILYGTTFYGGDYGKGVIFSYYINSGKDSIFSFNSSNGANPDASLLMVPDSLLGLGVPELSSMQANVAVYPNPSNGNCTLSVQNINSASTIEVYNVLGEKVFTESLSQNQNKYPIALFSQPNGIYLYRLTLTDGTLICNGKLVIEK